MMSDAEYTPDNNLQRGGSELFSAPPKTAEKRGIGIGIVVVVALCVLVGGIILLHRSPAKAVPLNTVLPVDPYAAKVSFTQLAMSESTSLSGGKSTFVDGHVRNIGTDTLTSVTMQVVFKNDEGLSPTVETLPLSVIRTHEPYVDTELLSAAPLKPGDEVEFRLIFETVPSNWNQQMPELRVIHVLKR